MNQSTEDVPFRVYKAEDRRDREAWIAAWRRWPSREVFAHPGYLEAMSPSTDHVACCAALRSGAGEVLYPFYLRPVAGGP